MDLDTITLCSSSRDRGGSVPIVYWHGDEFIVDWYDPGSSSSYLRSREVVS